MKWAFTAAKSGDIVRVRLNSFYHYGIFVSDGEVIQFGHPLKDAQMPVGEISVHAVSIADFAAGRPVEVGCLSSAEKLRRIPRRKTVSMAREAIGQKGYDLLRSNCEHFATKCVFGVPTCSAVDEMRRRVRMMMPDKRNGGSD